MRVVGAEAGARAALRLGAARQNGGGRRRRLMPCRGRRHSEFPAPCGTHTRRVASRDRSRHARSLDSRNAARHHRPRSPRRCLRRLAASGRSHRLAGLGGWGLAPRQPPRLVDRRRRRRTRHCGRRGGLCRGPEADHGVHQRPADQRARGQQHPDGRHPAWHPREPPACALECPPPSTQRQDLPIQRRSSSAPPLPNARSPPCARTHGCPPRPAPAACAWWRPGAGSSPPAPRPPGTACRCRPTRRACATASAECWRC